MFDSIRRRKQRNFKGIPGLHPKQPDSLELAVAEAIQKQHLDWGLKIYYRPDKKPIRSSLVEIPLSDAADIVENIEAWLRSTYGAGHFIVNLFNKSGTGECEYHYEVGGAAPYRGKGGSKDGDGDSDGLGTKGERQNMMTLVTTILMKLLDGKTNGDPLDQALKLVELTRPQGADPFQQQMLSTLMDNFFVEKSNMFTNLREAMEAARAFAPQINEQDPTIAMIASLAPMVTAFIASRTGGAVQDVMPNVFQQLQAIPDDQIKALASDPKKLKALMAKMAGGSAAPSGVALPAPGQSTPPPVDSPRTQPVETETPLQQAPLQPIETTGPPPPDAHMGVIDTMVEQFRNDIRSHVDWGTVAGSLFGIVEYNRALPQPHRLFTGLVNATVDDYEREFSRFCAAVPELTDQAAKQNLELSMTALLIERHAGSQDTEPVEELDMEPEEIRDERAADDDAPESSGVRGHGERPGGDGAIPEQPREADGVTVSGEAEQAA